MANLETQVEALTGETLSGVTRPTQDQLSTFLSDGVLDVTHRWLTLKPADAVAFTRNWKSGAASLEKIANGTDTDNSDFSTGTSTNWIIYEGGGAADHNRITNVDDREFTGGIGNWTVAGSPGDHPWDDIDVSANTLKLNSDVDAVNRQTISLDGSFAGTDGYIGSLRLTYDIFISSFSGTGSLQVGMMTDNGTINILAKKNYTATTGMWVYGEELEFTMDVNCQKLGIICNIDTDVTVKFDNFSIRPLTATHINVNDIGNYMSVDPGGDGTHEGMSLAVSNLYPAGGNPFTIGKLYRMSASMRARDSGADAGPVTFALGGASLIPTNMTTGDMSGKLAYNSGGLQNYQADIIATTTNGDVAIYVATPSDADQFIVDNVTIDELNLSPQITASNMISVQRESGSSGDWREAKSLPIGVQSRATDSDSLFLVSKYHPAFFISEYGNIEIVPTSDGSVGERYQLYYVNNEPVTTDLTPLAFSSTTIQFFPLANVPLVVKYAALQVLTCVMGDLAAQISPLLTTKVSGTISETGQTDLTSISNEPWSSIDYSFNDENLDFRQWFKVAGDMIQRQEDISLAEVQLAKIQQFIQAYSSSADANMKTFTGKMKDLLQRYQWIYQDYSSHFEKESERQEKAKAAQAAQQQRSRAR